MNRMMDGEKKPALWHPYETALKCAEKLIKLMNWDLHMWQVVGEIRRGENFVRSIEIVIVPRKAKLGVMKRTLKRECSGFDDAKDNTWSMMFEGISVVVYLANKQNFRVLELLKTGPESFTDLLVAQAVRQGFTLDDRGFRKGNKPIVPEREAQIFEEVGSPYLRPDKRSDLKYVPRDVP